MFHFKKRHIVFIIGIIIIADQVLKIYIKTHFHPGESVKVLGNWFQLYFIENEGMAYGWQFGGGIGKLALTLFRLGAVIFGVFYLKKIIEQKFHPGYILLVSLIFAGAFGNLIDSLFYGMIFDKSSFTSDQISGIFTGHGYGTFLHGNVVDMLYFPIIDTHFPSWFPIWGGKPFSFFNYIFNIADASVSIGVIGILLFRRRFFGDDSKKNPEEEPLPFANN
ncbi:MAG: lipoprotein signal peptidase [Ginsengibacter sp.]